MRPVVVILATQFHTDKTKERENKMNITRLSKLYTELTCLIGGMPAVDDCSPIENEMIGNMQDLIDSLEGVMEEQTRPIFLPAMLGQDFLDGLATPCPFRRLIAPETLEHKHPELHAARMEAREKHWPSVPVSALCAILSPEDPEYLYDQLSTMLLIPAYRKAVDALED